MKESDFLLESDDENAPIHILVETLLQGGNAEYFSLLTILHSLKCCILVNCITVKCIPDDCDQSAVIVSGTPWGVESEIQR